MIKRLDKKRYTKMKTINNKPFVFDTDINDFVLLSIAMGYNRDMDYHTGNGYGKVDTFDAGGGDSGGGGASSSYDAGSDSSSYE